MTDTTCQRCGATTPHETFAAMAVVNIEQRAEIERLRAALAVFANTENWYMRRGGIFSSRVVLEWCDPDCDPVEFAADALKGGAP